MRSSSRITTLEPEETQVNQNIISFMLLSFNEKKKIIRKLKGEFNFLDKLKLTYAIVNPILSNGNGQGS